MPPWNLIEIVEGYSHFIYLIFQKAKYWFGSYVRQMKFVGEYIHSTKKESEHLFNSYYII